MTKFRAYLLGSVCLGLVSMQYGLLAEDAPEQQQPAAAAPSEPQAAAPAADAPAPAETPAAELPMTPPGITDFYGDTSERETMPFRAEAKMNPDYSAAEAAPAATEATPAASESAPAATEPEAAAAPAPAVEAELPLTPPGITDFYGDTSERETMPFRADAKMNPDYVPAQAAAPEPAAPEVAATVAPELPMTPPGATDFYGDTSARETMPFRAEAKMNPDYNAAPAPSAAATEPAKQEAVEACRDALNAEAHAGKINFAMSSWDIAPDSFRTLDKIAKIAKDCSAGFVIEVGGHTDNTGKPASNRTISEFRARSVVKYLIKAGVAESKLKAVGYGQDSPVADNGTVEGRRQNRRIEFLVSGG